MKIISIIVLSFCVFCFANGASFINSNENRTMTNWKDLHLNLDHYSIIWITKKSFENLTEPLFENFTISQLSLMDNMIKYTSNVTFSKIIGLTSIRIGRNQLRSFYDLIACQYDLRIVSAFSNRITELAWESSHECIYPYMASIDLSHNQISYIMDNAFESFCNLIGLTLTSNKITFISNKTFSGLTQLNSLYLANNQIKSIESNAFYDLDALGNFFWCFYIFY